MRKTPKTFTESKRATFRRCITLIIFCLAGSACGTLSEGQVLRSVRVPTLKMQHQILFRMGDEIHVFDGYLLLGEQRLMVKAFAGPGIELFTILRKGEQHAEKLHIPSLAGKIDIRAVGADIARIYLKGCGPVNGKEEVKCEFFGEPLVERFNSRGRLIERYFPEAHHIGLKVRFEDYQERDGLSIPHRITLNWQGSENSMVIVVVGYKEINDKKNDPLAQLDEMMAREQEN